MIAVDQQGTLLLHADIAQDLIDKMVQMLNAVPAALAKFCKPCGAAFPGCGRAFQRVPLCSNFLSGETRVRLVSKTLGRIRRIGCNAVRHGFDRVLLALKTRRI